MTLPPPRSTLFPYTTLFRSQGREQRADVGGQFGVLRLVLAQGGARSEEHTSELQSLRHLVCRLLLEKKKRRHTKARRSWEHRRGRRRREAARRHNHARETT